ncbi:hypothetical protein [Actinoallomurus sp. NPDC050550]|uniref:hypothetical protein n=1 Tax=Actinoallomurus sp. NPDC050550 TaxID=3154937 RepID=UPI0033E51964
MDLVFGMVSVLMTDHWKAADVDQLASGKDFGGRGLPSNAWMALRRLGWVVAVAEGVKVNDRIVRMAQEQAGRGLRSAKWRSDLTTNRHKPRGAALGAGFHLYAHATSPRWADPTSRRGIT